MRDGQRSRPEVRGQSLQQFISGSKTRWSAFLAKCIALANTVRKSIDERLELQAVEPLELRWMLNTQLKSIAVNRAEFLKVMFVQNSNFDKKFH